MRKFLFFIILTPFFASLGHDIYIYTQDQRKGFMLSDVGAIWSKYHKESHDQWKIKVQEVSDIVDDLQLDSYVPKSTNNETQTLENGNAPDYIGSFTQTSEENKESVVTPLQENKIQETTSKLQKCIGFLLEQKAVFVFAAFAALIFILNAILSFIFSMSSGKGEGSSSKRIKKSKSPYSRK